MEWIGLFGSWSKNGQNGQKNPPNKLLCFKDSAKIIKLHGKSDKRAKSNEYKYKGFGFENFSTFSILTSWSFEIFHTIPNISNLAKHFFKAHTELFIG